MGAGRTDTREEESPAPAGRRQLPDWLSTVRILALFGGLPALVVVFTISGSLTEAGRMLPRWILGFAVVAIFSIGLRRHLYSRPRACPKCPGKRSLARTGRRDPAEPDEGETKAWLDEWRCAKCGYVEWIRLAMYRLGGGRG